MKDDSPFTHVLYHDDLSQLRAGSTLGEGFPFHVISRGLGKYIELRSQYWLQEPSLLTFGEDSWRDYRLRAIVTPVSFENSNPAGVFCGIVARYKHSTDYVALVLDRDEHLKLLRRTVAGFELLASASLEFCIGQSLSLTLTIAGGEVLGTAGPYAGATTVRATLDCAGSGGKAGLISTSHSRFGPHTVECAPEEAARIDKATADSVAALSNKRANFPQMKLERTVPLHRLVQWRNLDFIDLNGDGKLEILAGQCSRAVAKKISLTKLTCLTALDFEGHVLWQAGVPHSKDDSEIFFGQDWQQEALPYRFHDVFGDGHPVVVCVFGYDIQLRDAKTGKILMSAQTPSTRPLSDEFKAALGGGTLFVNKPRWGDETLNMDVSRIAFCDTQGNGAKGEIIVADEYNLAVLDPLAEPTLHPIFQHRGDLRGGIWIGDIDGDGKDEILAGSSLLDDDGALLKTVRCAASARSLNVFDLPHKDAGKRVCVCAGAEGMWIFDTTELMRDRATSQDVEPRAFRIRNDNCSKMAAGKFRADLPGIQYAVKGGQTVTFFDANMHKMGSHRFKSFWTDDVCAVNWTGKAEQLLLISMENDGGLIDGHGDLVVTVPSEFGHALWKVIPGYCPDGRDAIAAWNAEELAIYVPAS